MAAMFNVKFGKAKNGDILLAINPKLDCGLSTTAQKALEAGKTPQALNLIVAKCRNVVTHKVGDITFQLTAYRPDGKAVKSSELEMIEADED